MKRCMLALAIALPVAAHAQSRTDPADPKTAAAPLEYESAFAGYRPFRDAKPAPWRQVNEEVKGAGGHAAHGAPKKDPADEKKPGAATPAQPAEHKH